VPGGPTKRLLGCSNDRGEASGLFEEVRRTFAVLLLFHADASNVTKLIPVLASIWKRARDLPKFKVILGRPECYFRATKEEK